MDVTTVDLTTPALRLDLIYKRLVIVLCSHFSVFFINSSDVEMYQAVVHNYEERQKVSYFNHRNFRFDQFIGLNILSTSIIFLICGIVKFVTGIHTYMYICHMFTK